MDEMRKILAQLVEDKKEVLMEDQIQTREFA
jgi:hypothetical protein